MKSKSQHLERKRRIIVGMSDARVSDCATELLVTYSLGSCIGVALYDPWSAWRDCCITSFRLRCRTRRALWSAP